MPSLCPFEASTVDTHRQVAAGGLFERQVTVPQLRSGGFSSVEPRNGGTMSQRLDRILLAAGGEERP